MYSVDRNFRLTICFEICSVLSPVCHVFTTFPMKSTNSKSPLSSCRSYVSRLNQTEEPIQLPGQSEL